MEAFYRALEAHRWERYEEAHSLLIECLESASNIRDGDLLANSLLLFADNLLHCFPEGEDPFECRKVAAEHALAVFRDLGDRRGESLALLTLASVTDDGLDLANASLAIARELDDRECVVKAACWIGNHLSMVGDKKEAFDSILPAVELAREIGNAELRFHALLVLGVAADSAVRLAAFDELAKIQPAPHWKRKFACRLNAVASLVCDDDATRAETWWNDCLSIARELNDVNLEGSTLRGLSELARARGDHARADDLEAMSDVMCPLPDMSEVIEAFEAGDNCNAWAALKAIVSRKSRSDR